MTLDDRSPDEAPLTPTKQLQKLGVQQAEVRAWARAAGLRTSVRGSLPDHVLNAYLDARARGEATG